jgi:hypothetical protein
MICKDKLFVNTDIDIVITLSGILANDIVSGVVTLTSSGASKTFSGAAVDIGATNITLKITNTDISVAGIYAVKITVTDTGGSVRGLTPCPGTIIFYE